MIDSTLSILVIGASGRTGLELIYQLSEDPRKDKKVHAFCRSPSKIPIEYEKRCDSIIQGNARIPDDIELAINDTNANIVIISIGNGGSVAKSDIRTVSARALATVMDKPEYSHVRAIIVSSIGAGASKMKIGMGMGTVLSYYARHVLKDHTGQETAFNPLRERTLIVRATGLTNNKAKGKIKHFGDKEKAPSICIDRVDLAKWVANEVDIMHGAVGGTVTNITGVKKA
mmetsp:Transcript_48641/g.146640  ORF Transcript_48641/g.146640 Transcript_48641/m.146640 type:complete len:229 (-) Transcript_48641:67-753(-)|eukprot:CAMPEP_0113575426 /NCGR_PEP_ID=MMETSP0015_2-20120614/27689_1 /TAXON_ID=2838 /ORGANISM="Odontella" /LENGTH=228 /DNA_ID=CAMNT_0000478659 /DNA_START=175 /DNA_END=861 /DNA_ORIENTATION=+ /assembly_acc=CAM_ASM_000160